MFGILDYLKIGGGVAGGILLTTVYWTGLPLLNEFPILHNIPLIGQLAVGHVEAVKEEARAGYVLLAEKTAAEAKAAELQRQLDGAATANRALERQQQIDAAADAQREKDRDNHILEMEMRLSQANRRCTISSDDLRDILRK